MHRQARTEVKEYFECPDSCGTFLEIDKSSISYKVSKDKEGEYQAEVRLGKCTCGCLVCPKW